MARPGALTDSGASAAFGGELVGEKPSQMAALRTPPEPALSVGRVAVAGMGTYTLLTGAARAASACSVCRGHDEMRADVHGLCTVCVASVLRVCTECAAHEPAK